VSKASEGQGGREADEQQGGITRRKLIETAAVAAPAVLLANDPTAFSSQRSKDAAARRWPQKGMNVILYITDQDRHVMHFPPGWQAQNMPGTDRLRRNGLTFNHAFTNACMCSPARSTLFSGYFPAQHGVKYTLESDMPASQYPQVELPRDLKNAATVMSAAGYTPVYKGKFHCCKPADGGTNWAPSDITPYGFSRWNPPDAGANQDISEAGGGTTDNDGRFINDDGSMPAGDEGVLDYLSNFATQQQPFFLVVSLVNPHDVLMYPKNYIAAGYDDSWLEGTIGLPSTVNEDLSTKPTVQAQFRKIFNLTGPIPTPQKKRDYINFYGNLMKSSDSYLVNILDLLDQEGLTDNTLIIRTADHGEMGTAHGGLRQKNFNFYEESLRVPLIYSNPRLYPKPRQSNALVSHVDFLPTLASLFHAPASARTNWEGVDYSRLIEHPEAPQPQNYSVFTYDDYQSGQASGPYPKPPNHIVSIRERRWKLAKYYDINHNVPPQWEMYDLKTDPNERKNLTAPGYKRTAHQEREYHRLRRKLKRVQETRLQPLS
jgi:choline-sulfatase